MLTHRTIGRCRPLGSVLIGQDAIGARFVAVVLPTRDLLFCIAPDLGSISCPH